MNDNQSTFLGNRLCCLLLLIHNDQPKLLYPTFDLTQQATSDFVLFQVTDRARPTTAIWVESAQHFGGSARGLVLGNLSRWHRNATVDVSAGYAGGTHAPGQNRVGLEVSEPSLTEGALLESPWAGQVIVNTAPAKAGFARKATPYGLFQIVFAKKAIQSMVVLLLRTQRLVFLRKELGS